MPSGQSIECITTVIPQQCCANYMEHIRPTNPLTQASRAHPAHSEGLQIPLYNQQQRATAEPK